MKKILVLGVCCVFALALAAQENVEAVRIHPAGSLTRPVLPRDPTAQTQCLEVPGTTPAIQGANVGDLIEIDYRYLNEAGCEPAADAVVTEGDAVAPSVLGMMPIDEASPGTRAMAYFFDAVQPGDAIITLAVDGQEYAYEVHVRESGRGPGADAPVGLCAAVPEEGAKLFRPYLAAGYSCSSMPRSGDYTVAVGDLIEIDYVTNSGTGKTCLKLPKIGLHHKALAQSALGSRYILTSLWGATRVATFFEAVQPGKAKITLKIGGRKYNYRFTVSEGIAR